MSVSLYVFFEDPFWVGLFSSTEGDTTGYCRVVFGQEPPDTELYRYILDNFTALKFHKTAESVSIVEPARNPKRRQRQAGKILKDRIGKKVSYQLIKKSLAESKRHSQKTVKNEQKNTEKLSRIRKRVIKHKEKHKGH